MDKHIYVNEYNFYDAFIFLDKEINKHLKIWSLFVKKIVYISKYDMKTYVKYNKFHTIDNDLAFIPKIFKQIKFILKKFFLWIVLTLFWVIFYSISKWYISLHAINNLITDFLELLIAIIFPFLISEIIYNTFIFFLINIFFYKKIKPSINSSNNSPFNFNFKKILFHYYLLDRGKVEISINLNVKNWIERDIGNLNHFKTICNQCFKYVKIKIKRT